MDLNEDIQHAYISIKELDMGSLLQVNSIRVFLASVIYSFAGRIGSLL